MHLTVNITVTEKEGGYGSKVITETTVKVEADNIIGETIADIAAVAVDRAIVGLESAQDKSDQPKPPKAAKAQQVQDWPAAPAVALGGAAAPSHPDQPPF